jgi:hypothetical protein
MESLGEFRVRTAFMRDSLPEWGGLCTRGVGSLECKVDASGRLKPFFGNTVVFGLEEREARRLENVQQRLYECCGDMLCADRLKRDSLHITLHDLTNGAPTHDTLRAMNGTFNTAMRILPEISARFHEPVLLRPTWVFSMVNTSIVQGYEPIDEEHCARLMAMYERLHEAVMPAYPFFTPHATLAYYRPAEFSGEQLQRLRAVLAELSESELGRMRGVRDGREAAVLMPQQLAYQEFFNMNDYRTAWRADMQGAPLF